MPRREYTRFYTFIQVNNDVINLYLFNKHHRWSSLRHNPCLHTVYQRLYHSQRMHRIVLGGHWTSGQGNILTWEYMISSWMFGSESSLVLTNHAMTLTTWESMSACWLQTGRVVLSSHPIRWVHLSLWVGCNSCNTYVASIVIVLTLVQELIPLDSCLGLDAYISGMVTVESCKLVWLECQELLGVTKWVQ